MLTTRFSELVGGGSGQRSPCTWFGCCTQPIKWTPLPLGRPSHRVLSSPATPAA